MDNRESMYEKLKALGMRLGAEHLVKPEERRVHLHGIETVIDGRVIENDFGMTFEHKERYLHDYEHGSISLCSDCTKEVLAAWAKTSRISSPDGQNVVFLDTETSGLFGGSGTYVFLVGLGFRSVDGFHLVQLFMRDPNQEAAFLAALNDILAQFDVVVTFNGKTFDVPMLNTRYLMNGFAEPFTEYEHVDMLHIARKLWRDRLPSRALGALEGSILNVYRSQEEVPGWLIPQIYFDYLRSGDARPLAGVFYHNAIDILSLAALYNRVAALLADPLTEAASEGIDMAAIARLYEELGWLEQAARLYERSLEVGDLPENIFFKTLERYALMRRRQKDWTKAVELWRTAAAHGMPGACLELSKYYEHRERNPLEALEWARRALEHLEVGIGEYPGKRLEKEVHQRIGRLYRRVYESFEDRRWEEQ